MTHTDHAAPATEDASDDADATASAENAQATVDAAIAAFARGDPVCKIGRAHV